MYIDEAWYMEAGKDMLQTGHQGNYPKSIGWPFILRIIFEIFGVSNWVALYTSTILGALTILTIFFMTFIITKNINLSLISSIMLSLSPAHIRWSASAETNIASVFFMSLAIFTFFLYYQKKKNSLLWLALITLAFTVQFRPENYLLVPLFIFGKIIYDKKFLKKISIKEILPFIVLAILSLANLIQILDFQVSTNWIESDTGGKETGDNWSLTNLIQNSLKYGMNIFNGEHLPLILSAFMLIGLFYMFHKQKKESLFLVGWFCSFWFIYFASWFQTLGGKERFYMSFHIILLIFISYGILACSVMLTTKINNIWIKKNALWLILVIVIISFIPYTLSAKFDYSDNAQLLETMIPELAEKDIPLNCVIIANLPTILKSTTNLNVIDINLFLDNLKYQQKIFNSAKCVLFFEDYCCLDWHYSNFKEKCDTIKDDFILEEFKSYSLKDKTYSFYNLNQKPTSIN
jgi:4-amino-4-deoxy-L-arabinose transferase-like glycosyltransferase